jgi:hypothetical protein
MGKSMLRFTAPRIIRGLGQQRYSKANPKKLSKLIENLKGGKK